MRHLSFYKQFLLALCFAASPASPGEFDQSHQAWTKFLEKHVKVVGPTSTVNYRAVNTDPSELLRYTRLLESVSQETFNQFSETEKLAFLINSYNAFTIKLIVDNYPVKSIKDIGGFFSSPWKKKFFKLLGKDRSLDEIEHEMIRKTFNEPRIHFALVCASVGCPALKRESYIAKNLDEQLESAGLSFLSDKQRNCLHPEEKKLVVSAIFKWYGDDFIKKHRSLEEFLAPRVTSNKENQNLILKKDVSISFGSYDWSLNETK